MAILTLVLSSESFAAAGIQKGTVEYVRVHDTQHGGWQPPMFWFTLNGVTNAASCATWQGNVLFIADSEYMLTLLLSTQISGKEIAVRYDDSRKTNGFCRADYVTTGNPPSLK